MEMAEVKENPTATAGKRASEARRRKILERGSDRLAFITGQTRSIPPETASPAPIVITESSLPPEPQRREVTRSGEDESELPKHVTSCESSRDLSHTIGRELLAKREGANGAAGSDATQEMAHLRPQVGEITMEKRIDASAPKSYQNLVSPASATASDERVSDAPRHLAPACYQSFSPKRISHVISSSENIRLLCATTIATLVVLSYRGYGFGGHFVSNLVTFKPLYLVLLTNTTVVLWMLLTNQDTEKDEDVRRAGGRDFDLGKALEIGLVVQQAIRAAFVDCSVCSLVMIVGIPFGAKGV